MPFLSRVKAIAGKTASGFMNGFNGQHANPSVTGAVPSMQPGYANPDNNSEGSIASYGSHIMNKYGRPIAHAIDTTQKHIADPSNLGHSFRQIMQNQSDKALGYVRDRAGNLMSHKEASTMGYPMHNSRYGGTVVNVPEHEDNDNEGDEQYMENGPQQQQPVQQQSMLGKRNGRTRGQGWSKFKNGITKAARGIGNVVKTGTNIASMM